MSKFDYSIFFKVNDKSLESLKKFHAQAEKLSIKIGTLINSSFNDHIKKSSSELLKFKTISNSVLMKTKQINKDHKITTTQLKKQNDLLNKQLNKESRIVRNSRIISDHHKKSNLRGSIGGGFSSFGLGRLLGVGAGVGILRSASTQETARIGFEKVFNGTTLQAKHFEKELKKLTNTIPMTNANMLDIGATAKQLGISNQDVAKFSSIVAKSSFAFDLDKEETSKNFAFIKYRMNLNVDQLKQTADMMNYLTNNYATTPKNIMNIMGRDVGMFVGAGLSDHLSVALSGVADATGSTTRGAELGAEQLKILVRNSINSNLKGMSNLQGDDRFMQYLKDLGEINKGTYGRGVTLKNSKQMLNKMVGGENVAFVMALLKKIGGNEGLIAMNDDLKIKSKYKNSVDNEFNQSVKSLSAKFVFLQTKLQNLSSIIYKNFKPSIDGAFSMIFGSLNKLGWFINKLGSWNYKIIDFVAGIFVLTKGFKLLSAGVRMLSSNYKSLRRSIVFIYRLLGKKRIMMKFFKGLVGLPGSIMKSMYTWAKLNIFNSKKSFKIAFLAVAGIVGFKIGEKLASFLFGIFGGHKKAKYAKMTTDERALKITRDSLKNGLITKKQADNNLKRILSVKELKDYRSASSNKNFDPHKFLTAERSTKETIKETTNNNNSNGVYKFFLDVLQNENGTIETTSLTSK